MEIQSISSQQAQITDNNDASARQEISDAVQALYYNYFSKGEINSNNISKVFNELTKLYQGYEGLSTQDKKDFQSTVVYSIFFTSKPPLGGTIGGDQLKQDIEAGDTEGALAVLQNWYDPSGSYSNYFDVDAALMSYITDSPFHFMR